LFGSYYLGVPKIDSASEKGVRLMDVKGIIEFEDVHFSYPTRKEHPVLNGLSWVANPGETIALVGHSGCGKSTSVSLDLMIGLLTRLYECDSGSIMIDGIDVREFNIHWLRNIVGVVQQCFKEPQLFNGTIKENILLGQPDLDDKDIIAACKTANAHIFIKKFSEGYNTKIGAGGVQLSGGQKQRIAIARTILRNPRILLLDEATSALDVESEIIVQNALKKASIGRTTIVIAHRMSTLRDCDKIIVLECGKVAESGGQHKQLCEKEGGIYANLVKSQRFEDEPTSPDVRHADDEHVMQAFRRSHSNRSSTSSLIKRLSIVQRSSIIHRSRRKVDEILKPNSNSTEKEKGQGGLLQLYSNCQGNYIILASASLVSVIRGLELPLYAYIYKMAFASFEQRNPDEMMRQMINVLAAFIAVGVGCWILIWGAVSLYYFIHF
uniref:ABC transporter domain-containing protein n=1 Tax=Dracunculus medinensis TaxID=318479 RepID=A0A0N4UQN6_DRAME